MRKYLYITAAVIMLAGCAKKDLAPQPVETATVETTIAETTTVAETEATEEATVETQVIIPTKFEVYKDEEPHYLMYYADEEHTYFNSFTSVSAPELGIESVSLLTDFVGPTGDDLHPYLQEGIKINEQTADYIFDYATLEEIPDNEFHRFGFNMGQCGIFSRDFSLGSSVPTADEIISFCNNELYLLSNGDFNVETTPDGDTVYVLPVGFTLTRADDSLKVYVGFAIVRFLDNKAAGVYSCFNTEDFSIASHYADYTLQSLEYTKQEGSVIT